MLKIIKLIAIAFSSLVILTSCAGNKEPDAGSIDANANIAEDKNDGSKSSEADNGSKPDSVNSSTNEDTSDNVSNTGSDSSKNDTSGNNAVANNSADPGNISASGDAKNTDSSNSNSNINSNGSSESADADNNTKPDNINNSGNTNARSTDMREITTMELVTDMGIGINLGNTMEACGTWINSNKVSGYETAWGSPIVTEDIIKGYKEAGFNVVRIPVAWSNLMAEDYTISPELMERVEEIVNYVLKNDMYVILNIHWDGGWFEKFSTEYDECMKKYTTIWNQISERFEGYGDYLMFESLNEEGCFNDIWNRYSSSASGKSEAYGILNNINKTFVDLIRSSGGNNPKRHLLIAGYATDIDLTCDQLFIMPDDPENRCAVSVHYYTPSTFAILEKDESWGKAQTTWGTDKDIAELKGYMDKMKTTFYDKGIPVIVGEFGVATKNKTEEQIRNYLTNVCREAYERGFCPVLWDVTGGGLYDRKLYKMIDPLLEKAFNEIGSTER